MEGIWRLLSYWRPHGCCIIAYTVMVYIHIVSYYGVARNCLHDYGFLDEHKTIYAANTPQSAKVALNL
jgi:hypothetical protein